MLVLILTALTASVAAEGEPKIAITEVKAFWCAVLDSQGSYQNMEKNITTFMGEFSSQGLQPVGPLMSIYFNSPADTPEADLKWATAFPIAMDVDVKAPLRKVEFKDQKAAVYLYVGPYDQLPQTYTAIYTYIAQNSFKILGPVFERYLNSPTEVQPDKLETEIYVPVEAGK